jgi:hypothetical protein
MSQALTLLRWSVVAALLLGSGAALYGVVRDPRLRSEHTENPTDELLAYDLTPPGSVLIGLLPKATELSLSSWCVVGVALPDQRFVYGIDAEWIGAQGRVLGRSELSSESRVSGDAEARDASQWAARLAYSNDVVTDSRTLRLLIPDLAGERPQAVRLAAHPGALSRVLVRTTFPEARGTLEVEAVEQSLTPAERAELDRDRTSLPFDELSPAFRSAALSHWQRRLDAAGVAGRDYQVTRLLIGSGRAPAGLRLAQRAPQLVRQSRALAYNVFGAVELELSAPTGAALSWSDGSKMSSELTVMGNDERLRIMVGRSGLTSTLVLRSAEPIDVPVRATIRREDAAAAVGRAEPVGTERLELVPFWLRSSYYRLDPEQPVPVEIAPGQNLLGVTLRAYADRPHGSLEARLGTATTRSELELPASEFERWSDGETATEARELFLQVPAGVTRVELRGDATLYVAPFTYDPEIQEDRLAGPFQRPLAPNDEWHFADCDVRHRVSTKSLEHERLVSEGRTLELNAQARVQGPPPRTPLPEMALLPRGTDNVRRHLVLPLVRTEGRPARESAWVTLDRPRRVSIASAGARAGQARLRYRILPEHLGQTLALTVDGNPRLSEQPITTAADVDVSVPPGEHVFALEGLGAGDAALLEVGAAPREPLLRQRIVYRLPPAGSLEFRIDKQAEAARLIVLAYAERPTDIVLSYSLGGKLSAAFAASHSVLSGRLSGPAVPLQGAWFWESTEPNQLAEFRDGVTLGADLERGAVRVKLKNETRARLWLTLVLVGQGATEAEGVQHFWALEDR